MDHSRPRSLIHLIISPNFIHRPLEVKKVGQVSTINLHSPTILQRSPLYWRRSHFHVAISCLAESSTIEITEPAFLHLLHYGFVAEVVKNNVPIYRATFSFNASLLRGFSIFLNVAQLFSSPNSSQKPHLILFKKQAEIRPELQNVFVPEPSFQN